MTANEFSRLHVMELKLYVSCSNNIIWIQTKMTSLFDLYLYNDHKNNYEDFKRENCTKTVFKMHIKNFSFYTPENKVVYSYQDANSWVY